jgi:hypothetical protein
MIGGRFQQTRGDRASKTLLLSQIKMERSGTSRGFWVWGACATQEKADSPRKARAMTKSISPYSKEGQGPE